MRTPPPELILKLLPEVSVPDPVKFIPAALLTLYTTCPVGAALWKFTFCKPDEPLKFNVAEFVLVPLDLKVPPDWLKVPVIDRIGLPLAPVARSKIPPVCVKLFIVEE